MYTLDQIYGSVPGGHNALDPSQAPNAMATTVVAPAHHVDGQPGGGLKPRTWAENPTFWLVACLGAGIFLFHYGTGGFDQIFR